MNETSGHHLVALALPLSPEELLTMRASVVTAATSWANLSLPKPGTASSQLPQSCGKSACCYCSQFRAFTSTKSTVVGSKMARQDWLAAVQFGTANISHKSDNRWSSAKRGGYCTFSSCFSPMIHDELVRSVDNPWKKPCYIFNEKLPCLNLKSLCVWRNKERNGQPLKGFLLPTA